MSFLPTLALLSLIVSSCGCGEAGTNYAQFLKEANRIVKTGGRVLIAEVPCVLPPCCLAAEPVSRRALLGAAHGQQTAK